METSGGKRPYTHIYIYLTDIFNVCTLFVYTGFILDRLKHARIIPILNKGSKLDISNHGPISLAEHKQNILMSYLLIVDWKSSSIDTIYYVGKV